MRTGALMIWRALISGMIAYDTVKEELEWGIFAAFGIWVVGVTVSLVPIVRTIFLFSVLLVGMAWWKAAVFTVVLQFVFAIADGWAMAADKRSLEGDH